MALFGKRSVESRILKPGDAIEAAKTYFPQFLAQRANARVMRAWAEGKQYEFAENQEVDDPSYGRAFAPDAKPTPEYENLRGLSPNAFAGLLVTSMSQLAFLEGFNMPGRDSVPAWDVFRRNRWAARQSSVYRGALSQGLAYGLVVPGKDQLTGGDLPQMRTRSSERMAAFYDEDDDEWPRFVIEGTPLYETVAGVSGRVGWNVILWEPWVEHHITYRDTGIGEGDRSEWTYIEYRVHGTPVTPVAQCANRIDLDGRAVGEIEPVLPLLRRLDQDTFDRVINQRFGAWQVRYIAGMAKPTASSEQEAQRLKLRVEDLLISTNADTKFGVLPGGDLENQIKATDHDLRLLSAISQVPPHHLLGLSSNLQSEALAAATEGLQRRGFLFRQNAGDFNEAMGRLVSLQIGDVDVAKSWQLSSRWRDTESGSMAQAMDALGKAATMLNVPIEMLWERMPGWTDTDVERAKQLVEDGSVLQKIMEALNGEMPGTESRGA